MAAFMSFDAKALLKKIPLILKRYRYAALILLLGIFLLLLPVGKNDSSNAEKTIETPEYSAPSEAAESERAYCERITAELEGILSKIDGAGKVCVMLTLKSGSEVQMQTDFETVTETSGDSVSGSTKQTTVILSCGSAYDEAAVVKTEYPVFQGALIVSEGADNAAVRLALEQAVSSLLGIGTDKITVVKMK